MNVKALAELNVKTCSPDTNLPTAAQIMWEGDCGVVPVVDGEQMVIGMLTDRDICIAAATRVVRPSEILVRDVMSREVATCTTDDDVETVLSIMKESRVRRLPVVDRDRHLAGIVSLTDLVMHADCRPGAQVSGKAFLDTMRAISRPVRQTVAA